MSKKISTKNKKVTITELTQYEKDILQMETLDAMNKYGINKQKVYDTRFALGKKLKQSKLTVKDVSNLPTAEPNPRQPLPGKATAKKAAVKTAPAKKVAAKKVAAKKIAAHIEEVVAFEVDENAPLPRRSNLLTHMLYAQLEKTIPTWKKGAIALPPNKANSARKYLQAHYPDDLWSIEKIAGNENAVRLHRFKNAKKPKD